MALHKKHIYLSHLEYDVAEQLFSILESHHWNHRNCELMPFLAPVKDVDGGSRLVLHCSRLEDTYVISNHLSLACTSHMDHEM